MDFYTKSVLQMLEKSPQQIRALLASARQQPVLHADTLKESNEAALATAL